MKKILIILQLVFIVCSVYSQKINSNYISEKIDTIYLFTPFGTISTIDQRQKQISPELTKMIGDTLRKLIIEQFSVSSIIIDDPFVNSDYTQNEIISNLDRIKTLDNDIFSKVAIGECFDSILMSHPGRYYGFIHYSGFINNKIKGTVVTSIVLMVVTSVLTAGILTVYLIPIPSEVNAELLIIDKEEKRLVYYVDKKVSRTFSINLNEPKLVKKLLKKYNKTYKID